MIISKELEDFNFRNVGEEPSGRFWQDNDSDLQISLDKNTNAISFIRESENYHGINLVTPIENIEAFKILYRTLRGK